MSIARRRQDQQSPQDELPFVDVVGAESNRPHGHIALGQNGGRAEVTFFDMGDHLSIWAFTSSRLDPSAARNLADELVAWADRKEAGR